MTNLKLKRLDQAKAFQRSCIASALLAATCLPTQWALAGDLRGVVSDPTLERFVEGATVVLGNRRTQTDRAGRYVFRDLEAGDYTISVSASSYDMQTVSVSVPATGEVISDIELSSAYVEEVIVSGARISQLIALQRKRSAVSILDAVSADTVGKLPDFNVAEAVQRLPGLSVEIDQGEGRYPIIRGIDSNLNNVTIDGNTIGAPEGAGRRVALDVIPSDLVSVVEVVKAVTPDLDGNAVGGNINIVTRSAFDSPEPFGNISVRAGYNDASGRVPYGMSGNWGSTLDSDGRWGLVLAGSYFNRRYDTELYAGDWSEVADGISTVDGSRLFLYDIERERIGLNANLDFRPNENAYWYLHGIFNEFTDEERRDQLDIDLARGDATVISDTLVSNTQGRASREYRQNDQTQRLYNVSSGGELLFGDWTWSGSYSFSHAEEITPRRVDWEYRSSGSAFPNTVDISRYLFEFDAGPALNNPEEYDFRRVRRRTDDIEEDVHSLRTDLRYDNLFNDRTSYLQVGLKYSHRDKFQDRENQNFGGAEDFTLADFNASYLPSRTFFSGLYDFGPALSFEVLEALFLSNPELFEFDPGGSAINSTATDYQINEDISAAYAMLSVDFGNTTILGGVRVERTEGDYDAFLLDLPPEDENNPGVPIQASNSYTNVLPSLHVTHRPSDDLVIRAAWTNTVGRPNFQDVVPSFEIDDDEGSSGNPDLEPFESMGFDLSLEYYLQPTGIISVGIFYKDIENPIFTRNFEDIVFNGVPFREFARPENGESGSLLGLELNWEQQFTNLPAPWDGLGAAINFTLIDSEVKVFGREDDDLRFFRQPDKIGNASIYYTTDRFEYRLAANYRDDYLQSVGSNAGNDIYFRSRTQLDFKVSFRASDSLRLFGEVQNLNDEPLTEYEGIASQLAGEERYGWTALVGATYAFY